VFWKKKKDLESEEFKKLNREIIIIKQDLERLDLDLLLWKKKLKGIKLGKEDPKEDQTKDIYSGMLLPE
jgi:hypothetical protein